MRTALPEDIADISIVLASSWKTMYRGILDDDYLDALQNDHWTPFLVSGLSNHDIFAMVIEENQEIIGVAILHGDKAGKEASLQSFYLLPDKIGQGFGHAFYTRIEADLINKGFSHCVLDVLETNQRAIRFYETHGFRDTGGKIDVTLGNHTYICRILKKAFSDTEKFFKYHMDAGKSRFPRDSSLQW